MSVRSSLRVHALPLLLALGAALGAWAYFALEFEPPWWVGVAVMALGWLVLLVRREGWGVWATGLFFCLAQVQVGHLAGQMPWQSLASKPHWVVGRVVDVAEGTTPGRVTLALADVTFYDVGQRVLTFNSVRVGMPQRMAEAAVVGQGAALRVTVYPPQGPRFPGEADYRLLQMGKPEVVYGYLVGKVEPTNVPDALPKPWMAASLDDARMAVKTATEPYAGGVLTSLLVADQRQIPAPLREAYRKAGLSHLLAVSGLQLTLVGGGVFWLVRWLLALWPALALRVNGKVWGAVIGLVAATAYAFLAGAPVSVQRALLMVGLLLMAALLGRLRSLVRAWAIAMLVVLALNPMAVMGAGFRLSFAAVAGLILLGLRYPHPQGWWQKTQWLGRSGVVAAWVTAPFVLAQFGQINLAGLLTNLVAVPAMGPLTLLAFGGMAAMPLGLGAPFFRLAGEGIDLLNRAIEIVAGWPLATIQVPMAMWPVMALMAGAALWLVLGRHGHSWLAGGLLVVTGLGLQAGSWVYVPQVTVMDGSAFATTPRGVLWGAGNHLAKRWALMQGAETLPEIPGTCVDDACSWPLVGGGLVLRQNTPPDAEDCHLAQLIVTQADVVGACPAQTLREGALAYALLDTHNRLHVTLPSCSRVWHKVGKECW